ncbi:acihydroxylase [Mycolicibacterium canariasense]|uniref:Acihydroxylase n=1 Tax=Mycolicibacterium canariasense TaxID=228230 RepID=A0A100WJE9_MYCCR|nr:FAD-dependent monooxygenase [Mycolicibacterium canariasense]MCV7208123.1 FAD-dependent monooxygenase [Mycolicibacterium canariasense]ORV09533.1 FAD-dependent oxidoreductase [Mycolicibacterium canariasense]GAS99133.1 acihydroxylase [Mycolicibacterium canariasense]
MAEPVVIAGAGPNGLLLACELALAGVRAVVLDQLPGPSAEPKANGLVGQVIRQLDMRGLYHAFGGEDGPPTPSPGWMFAGMSLSFLGLQGNPMYALLVPQPRLVRLLERRARDLGVDIRWGHALADFRQTDDVVTATVHADGRRYELTAEYLVGADGGRSMVRKNLGVEFTGHTSDIVSRIAHVHLAENLLVPGRGYDLPGFGLLPFGYSRFERGSTVVFPLEPDRPMVGTVEYGWTVGGADGPVSLDELRCSLRRILGVDVPLEAPRKAGAHALRRLDGINSRQAQRYRVGRVLLLGDAAHVHSPMGGPGLNLGMQDAVNLGWKLAAVVNGWAADALLDTYHSERYPVGERVMMHSMAQLALAAPGPEVDALRTLFAELAAEPEVAAHLAGLLAGSDVRYDVGDDHPLAGRMVPDLTLDDGRRVADLLHEARPVLLDLSGGVLAVTGLPDRVYVVTGGCAAAPAALLLRPDGYVAWAADTIDAAAAHGLAAAVARWCGQPSVARIPTVT